MSHWVLLAFAIRDAKMDAFLPPFFCRTAGEAVRMFENDVRGGESTLSKNPEDYGLFQVGSYDQQTAQLEALASPLQLCQALQVVNAARRHGEQLQAT